MTPTTNPARLTDPATSRRGGGRVLGKNFGADYVTGQGDLVIRILTPIITRNAAAYLSAILRLLPVGSAWPRSPTSTLYKICGAAAEEYARIDWRTSRLLEEADPRTVTGLFDEWETSFGLPDP